MNVIKNDPPRTFEVGSPEHRFTLKDCAHITLEPDEQVTFLTESGAEYDVARKDWGFYATPSLNDRLLRFNLHAVLVKNQLGKFFVLFMEENKQDQFQEYLRLEHLDIITWLDNSDVLENLERCIHE